MNFKYEGQVFDTATLHTFQTGDRWIPFVWMTSDEKAVFYATVDDDNALEIRRASNADIRRLAGRYKLDSLRKAQSHPGRGREPAIPRQAGNPSGNQTSSPCITARSQHLTCPSSFSFP